MHTTKSVDGCLLCRLMQRSSILGESLVQSHLALRTHVDVAVSESIVLLTAGAADV